MKPIVLAFFFLLFRATSTLASDDCVRIYYDDAPDESVHTAIGETHAIFLQNLIGHFKDLKPSREPISKYRAGDIDLCRANFYIGTYYDRALPASFLLDYANTDRTVVWMGYNTWKLPPDEQEQLWGARFERLSTLAQETSPDGYPGFYRDYEYKGEIFTKYAGWDRKDPSKLMAAYEISIFQPSDDLPASSILSWAVHSSDGSRTPFVIRKANHWLFAESPFSFMTGADRYMIFTDLLFDILDVPPLRASGPKPALVRIEDIHPLVPLWELRTMTSFLEKRKIPYSISLIPIFADPLGVQCDTTLGCFVPISKNPAFVEFLRSLNPKYRSYILHGVTHQYGQTPNPFNGVSGDDFEFWDYAANGPVPEDSVDFVLDRVEDGWKLLEDLEIRPSAWVTPHYQASSLDYLIFGQLFSWSVGRVIYSPFTATLPPRLRPELALDRAGSAGRPEREARLAGLEATAERDALLPAGQFFPYEIFQDVYGQRLIPENIGNIQPYLNEEVYATISIDDMIASMKRNRVLRDAWASLFIHPFVVNSTTYEGTGAYPGDTASLERLFKAAQDFGYEFIDLKTWTTSGGNP